MPVPQSSSTTVDPESLGLASLSSPCLILSLTRASPYLQQPRPYSGGIEVLPEPGPGCPALLVPAVQAVAAVAMEEGHRGAPPGAALLLAHTGRLGIAEARVQVQVGGGAGQTATWVRVRKSPVSSILTCSGRRWRSAGPACGGRRSRPPSSQIARHWRDTHHTSLVTPGHVFRPNKL